jgi:uncharacterized protein YidB (DUF937 family)
VQPRVGSGANHATSPDQFHQALGRETVAQMSHKVGINPPELLQKLSTELPRAVDPMPPTGAVPTAQVTVGATERT